MNLSLSSKYTAQDISGILIFISMLLSIISALLFNTDASWAGILYWIALFILWNQLSATSKRQSLILSLLGVMGIILGSQVNFDTLERTFAANNGLISLLIAVGFLSLSPISEHTKISPAKGKGAALSSYLGVHFIGAVINYAAVLIFADRMKRHTLLNHSHAIILSRAFASAGFWSPFYITMAVALSFTPGHNYMLLLSVGVILAIVALLYTMYEISHLEGKKADFTGEKFSVHSLGLPFFLLFAVLAIHFISNNLSILHIITIVSPIIGILSIFRHQDSLSLLVSHILEQLPRHANELALFLSAGLFSLGLSSMIPSLPGSFLFTEFSYLHSAFFFIAIIFLALIGIHPLISISFIWVLLAPANPDPTLLALMFFGSWSLSSAVGPLSGQNIGLQARYGLKSIDIMKWNSKYTVVMAVTILIFLYFLSL